MAKDVRRDIADRDLGRALGRRIARLERHLREVETASQAAFRSIEDGALDFYDDDGVLRERIGKQADGSWGRVVKEGPVPPAPTEPDVVVISDGVVAVTWDGRTEEPWPYAEFRAVRVHLGETSDFTPDRDNQVGAIWAARGGTIVAVTESDDDNPVWVKLAAVSTAGHWTESAAVLVDELDEDDLEEEPEELQWEDGDGHTVTAADITAGAAAFNLSHIPEEEALLAWWHPGGAAYAGVPKDPTTLTVDREASTVTWPLGPHVKVDDRLRVYYPYYDLGAGDRLSVPVGAIWKWKDGLGSGAGPAAVGYDDAAWATGPSGFGRGAVSADVHTITPPPVPTAWDVWTRLVATSFGGDLEITINVDLGCTVYVDGVQVYTRSTSGRATVTVPAAAGAHTFAVYAYDTASSLPGEGSIIVVSIEEQ